MSSPRRPQSVLSSKATASVPRSPTRRCRALEAAGAKLSWEEVPAGLAAVETDRDPLPAKTTDSITKNRLALKGPLGTPIGVGFRSVNVGLRQLYDLYANVRPVLTFPGAPARYENVDIVVVRENTEDLYAGVEHYVDARRNAAESIAIITRFGSTRIAEYAFEYARRHGRKTVCAVHKANIMKMSNGLFLECVREVSKKFPDINMTEMIVDAACMKLVIDPSKFDVIVTMNLFGDIISDLTAGLVGGLGMAPAGNIGVDAAIFEAVHGTAPDIAGKGPGEPHRAHAERRPDARLPAPGRGREAPAQGRPHLARRRLRPHPRPEGRRQHEDLHRRRHSQHGRLTSASVFRR